MKALKFMILACALVMVHQAHAQKNTPLLVQRAFEIKYPKATHVSWSAVENDRFQADFRNKRSVVSAQFSKNAKWLETRTIVNKKRELPRMVRITVDEAYPNAAYDWMEWVELPEQSFYRIALITAHEETEPVIILVTKDGKMDKEVTDKSI